MNAYVIGQSVRLSATFTDLTGANYDPNTVTFSYRTPSGNVTDLIYGTDAAVVKDAVGKYHADIDTAVAGTWHYRAEGAGGGQAAAEGVFYVTPSEI